MEAFEARGGEDGFSISFLGCLAIFTDITHDRALKTHLSHVSTSPLNEAFGRQVGL